MSVKISKVFLAALLVLVMALNATTAFVPTVAQSANSAAVLAMENGTTAS